MAAKMAAKPDDQWQTDLVTISVQSSSNIVEALHRAQTKFFNEDYVDSAIPDSIEGLNGLLKSALRYRSPDEPPLTRQTDQLRVKAYKLFKINRAGYTIGNERANFFLPSSIGKTAAKRKRSKRSLQVRSSGGVSKLRNVFQEPSVTHSLSRLKRDAPEEPPSWSQQEFGAVMMEFSENPYRSGEESRVDSGVVSLDLYDDEGKLIVVEDLEESIEIIVPREQELPLPSDVITLDKSKLAVTTIAPLGGAGPGSLIKIVIEFMPLPPGVASFPVAFMLWLRPETAPNLTYYDYKDVYPAEQNRIEISFQYSFFNKTAKFALVDALFNAGPPIRHQARERNFTLQIYQSSCLYLSDNGRWSGRGCHATNRTTATSIHCRCDHLTTFGGKVDFLTPNDLALVDIESLFDLEENPITFAMVSILVLVYLVLFVICVRRDQHDLHKDRVIHLEDNNKTDHQTYVIVVETGLRRGAGTTAKVSLVLHGEEGMSETRELLSLDSSRSLFERNSRDVFIMTLPESIGPIWKIQLWHNNAGSSPSWFLSRVTVHDSTQGKNYYFNCEKWLAVEVDDGKVEREFMALDSGFAFDQILWIKGTQYFADLHLWTSLLTRPSYSRFLRVERLTCCLTLICSYMCVSAMWYQEYEKEYRGSYGFVDISWRSVVVGLLTAVIVLPVNLLLVLLFRKSRLLTLPGQGQSGDQSDDALAYQQQERPPGANQNQSSTLLNDQRFVKNWQSLQQWAQLQWMRKYQNASISSTDNVKPMLIEQVRPMGQAEAEATTLPGVVDDASSPEAEANAGTLETENESEEANDRQEVYNNRQNSTPQTSENVNDVEQGREKNARNSLQLNEGENLQTYVHLESVINNNNDEEENNVTNFTDLERIAGNHDDGAIQDCIQMNDLDIARTIRASLINATPTVGPTSSGPPKGAAPSGPPPTALRRSSLTYHKSVSERSSTISQASSARYKAVSKSSRILAPSGLRVVAWLLCFLISGGCCTVTIMYGFRFGYQKSVMWLQSLFFSCIMCFFVSHPVVILVLTLYAAVRYRGSLAVLDHHQDELTEELRRFDRKRRLDMYEVVDDDAESFEKGIAARQRSRYLRFARPPQEKQLIESRKETIRQRKARSLLWNSLLYAVFVGVVLVIAFAEDKGTPYRLNQSVRTAFYANHAHKPMADGEMKLEGVAKPADWWRWAMTSFLDAAYWETWYNGEETLPDVGRMHYALEGALLRIGPILLTQRRVQDVYCSVQYKELQRPSGSCKPSWGQKDWQTYGNESSEIELVLSDKRWEALDQLQALESSDWLDRDTSDLTIRLVLYQPASRVYIPVEMRTEFTQLGKASASLNVEAVRLFRYTNVVDKVRLACELIFISLLLLKIQIFLTGAVRRKSDYFRHRPWHYAELCLLVTSSVYVVMYILRFVFVYDVIDHMRQTFYEEYVDLWFVATWDRVVYGLVGLIQFLTFVDLIKLLRYGQLFTRYLRVYKRARREIGVFLILALILLFAYAGLGTVWFQSSTKAFMTFGQALMTSCSLLTLRGRSVQDQGAAYGSDHVQVFVATVVAFALGLLLTYIAVVFIYAFQTSKKDNQLTMTMAETLTFYWSEIKRSFSRKNADLKEEESYHDKMLPAEFTMAEIEYQVEELLFKMNAILGTHNLPEKTDNFFTDSDCTYSTGGTEPQNQDGGSRAKGDYYTDSDCTTQSPVSDDVVDWERRKSRHTAASSYDKGNDASGQVGEVAVGKDSGNATMLEGDSPSVEDIEQRRSSVDRPVSRRSAHRPRQSSPQVTMTTVDKPRDPDTSYYESGETSHQDDDDSSVSDRSPIPTTSQSKLSHWSSRQSLHNRIPRSQASHGGEATVHEAEPALLDIPIHSLDDSGAHSTTQYVDFCDDFFDDFSTSSDCSLPRSSRTDHSLRKTKSRGKGARKNFFGSKDVLDELRRSSQDRSKKESKKKKR